MMRHHAQYLQIPATMSCIRLVRMARNLRLFPDAAEGFRAMKPAVFPQTFEKRCL